MAHWVTCRRVPLFHLASKVGFRARVSTFKFLRWVTNSFEQMHFFYFLFYFILFFFVCVNKENDTDQNALASIKLLIVVQRMVILFFGAKPRAICANHSIRQILNRKFIITIEYYDFHAISFIEKPIYYDCKFHLIVDTISYSSRELQIDAIIVSGRFVRFSLFHASISRATWSAIKFNVYIPVDFNIHSQFHNEFRINSEAIISQNLLNLKTLKTHRVCNF